MDPETQEQWLKFIREMSIPHDQAQLLNSEQSKIKKQSLSPNPITPHLVYIDVQHGVKTLHRGACGSNCQP